MADPSKDPDDQSQSLTEDSSLSRIVEVRLPEDSVDESDDRIRRPFSASPIGSSRRSPYFMLHSPVSAYETNQERTLRRDDSASTISETHLLHKEGVQDNFFTEEHWSSEIKSFVTSSPPKFLQVIKAYSVLATDRLTLVVEVSSDPPAIFDWFCNDRPVSLDRRRFTVRHAVNATTLTVDGPDHGVYSCSARNPAGVSKTYGFVTVHDPAEHRESLLDSASSEEAARLFTEQQNIQVEKQQTSRRPPKFTNQIPNLTLKPGNEAIIDVEVDSNTWTKFMWYVNGKLVQHDDSNVDFFSPKPNRCVALFKIPASGEYSVVAQNEAGIAKSSGYVEVSQDASAVPHPHLLRSLGGKAPLPAAQSPRRAASITKTTVHSVTYVSRSNSLPRNEPIDESPEARLVRQSMTPERFGAATAATVYAPKFVQELPSQIFHKTGDRLVIKAQVMAQPAAEFQWNFNGKLLSNRDGVSIVNTENESLLSIEPPLPCGSYDVIATNFTGSAMQQIIVYNEDSEEAKILKQYEKPRVVENITTLVRTDVQRESLINHSDEDSDDTFVIYSANEDDIQAGVIKESETIKKSQDVVIPPSVPHPQKPIFIEMPASQLISLEDDEPFKATVRLEAFPYAQVRWYFKNFELKPDDAVVLIDDEPNVSTLIHKKPQSGLYRAVAMNEHGMTALELRVFANDIQVDLPLVQKPSSSEKVEYPVNIEKKTEEIASDFDRPPSVIKPLQPIHRAPAGQTIVLETEVDAAPPASFQWKFNNVEIKKIPNKIRIDERENKSKITLNDPQEGRYEVVALNDLGKCASSTKFILNVEDELKFVESLPEISTGTKEGLRIQVTVNSATGIFKWFANGSEVTNSEEYQIEYSSDSSTLVVLKTKREPVTLKVVYELNGQQIASETVIAGEQISEENSDDDFLMADMNLQELGEYHHEPYNGTTQISKEEEKFNLLVKVAESLAESLVANIILQAVRETSLRLALNSRSNKLDDGYFHVTSVDALAPRFQMSREYISVKEGGTLTIHQTLTGAPCWSVIWLKNGVEIYPDERTELISTEGHVQLVVRDLTSEDLGEYSCRVENGYGCAEFIGRVTHEDNKGYHEWPENIAHSSLNIDIKDGTLQQIIECIIADIPLLQSGFTIGRSVETTAVVNLKISDAGKTPTDPSTSFEMVNMPPTSSMSPIPSIIVEEHVDKEGDDAVETIDKREVTAIQVETENLEDEFEIVGSSYTQVTEASSEEQLSSGSEVTLPPRFQQSLSDISCRENKTHQLKCVVTGVPVPTVKWLFNGNPIDPDNHREILYEDGVAILRIHNVSSNDEGNYVCVATNPIGTEVSAGSLKVTGYSEATENLVDDYGRIAMSAYEDPSVRGTFAVSRTDEEENLQRIFMAGECRRTSLSLHSPTFSAYSNDYLNKVATDINTRPELVSEAAKRHGRSNIVHGRMISFPSDERSTPQLMYSQPTLNMEQVSNVSQGWEMKKEPQNGKTFAYFYPFPFSECFGKFDEPPPRLLYSPVMMEKAVSHLNQMHFDDSFEALMEAYHINLKKGKNVIEKTIYEVSDSLVTGSLSRVQNEVSEELLRSRIAETILNLHGVDYPVYYKENLKPTFDSLEKRLKRLEDVLIIDEDKRLEDELREINMLKSDATYDRLSVSKREEDVKVRFDNVARMTPLIHMVKEKVSKLNEFAKTPTTSNDDKNNDLHLLLRNIAKEINVIHKLCRQSADIDNINNVIEVLTGVCSKVDHLMDDIAATIPRSTALPYARRLDEVTHHTLTLQGTGDKHVTKACVKVQENAKVHKRIKEIGRDRGSTNPHSSPEVQMAYHSISEPFKYDSPERLNNDDNPERVTLVVSADTLNSNKGAEKTSASNHNLIPVFEVTSPETIPTKSEISAETLVTARRRTQQKDVQGFLLHPSMIRSGNQFLFDDPVDVTTTESRNSAMSDDENTLTNVPILFCKSVKHIPLETAILSDDDTDEFHVSNIKSSCSETFRLKKRRRNYRVSAFVYPAVSKRYGVTISDNNYHVEVDQEPDAWMNSATIFSNSFFSTEVYIEGDEGPNNLPNSMERSGDGNAEMSVSINARSFYDAVHVNLDQTPYYKTQKDLTSNKNDEGIYNSALLNVTVSDITSKGSSHRSSQRSLVMSDYTVFSQHSFDVPTYVVKKGSTASITCELNNSVSSSTKVEWFAGKKHIRPNNKKYQRVKETLMEALVINDVNPSDSELYSISLDNEIYPVAYLIVEAGNPRLELLENAPETMFVMEGQAVVLSSRLPEYPFDKHKVQWLNGSSLLRPSPNLKITMEDGFSRVIINEVALEDQGVYTCYCGDLAKTITLIVEEQIDEREVQVSSAETDNEDLNDYLVPIAATLVEETVVPIGTNVTIRCETLHSQSEIAWQHEKQNITPNERFSWQSQENNRKHILTISQVEITEEGEYGVLVDDVYIPVAILRFES
uniref:Immunoglobulin I-set domain protein n=1 Tax=Bursaphelenchus xylophilus TaxID=6326 RepID=A0A1I7RN68_BURXY